MEFTNEIFFNKNLIANETIILTYCGKLYSEHSKYVSIVYGYGDDWSGTSEAPMKEIENGFEVTIDIKDYSTFNFCFKNNFNIWDNNFGFNYIAPISSKEALETTSHLDSTSEKTSDQTKDETYNNTSIDGLSSEDSSSSTLSIKEVNENEEEINENQETSESNNTESEIETNKFEGQTKSGEKNEIETIFSSLLDSILDETPNNTNINLENLDGFGLQSVDEIKEESSTEFSDELDTISNTATTETTTTEPEEKFKDAIEPDELDNLMNFILTSITEKNNSNIELSSPIENNDPSIISTEENNINPENVNELEITSTEETTPDIIEITPEENLAQVIEATAKEQTTVDIIEENNDISNIANIIDDNNDVSNITNITDDNNEVLNIANITNDNNDVSNITNISDNDNSNIPELTTQEQISSTSFDNVQEISQENVNEVKQEIKKELLAEAESIVAGLPAIKSNNLDWFDNFIDSSYRFFKKVETTLKKFGTLLKLKAQEYGIIKEK